MGCARSRDLSLSPSRDRRTITLRYRAVQRSGGHTYGIVTLLARLPERCLCPAGGKNAFAASPLSVVRSVVNTSSSSTPLLVFSPIERHNPCGSPLLMGDSRLPAELCVCPDQPHCCPLSPPHKTPCLLPMSFLGGWQRPHSTHWLQRGILGGLAQRDVTFTNVL